ncbi:hypothetical protein PMI42_05925 [Bradyrhizobium sp. YR681]|uniref:hypothetical protein n=1 Tax=Bradyrhizobium sp. YR681 TaxID=1144344 RepID=UPI00026F744F|nr:hypothetical protein [Bradyrhizobium sp. YR681]EJN10757.1 hypothetical protein PMI42_05925 [Bradyrhizobium sp. YR681]
MAIVFDVQSLGADLKAFSQAARGFLSNHQRLVALEAQLSNAASEAKLGNRTLEWTTNVGEGPICSLPSSSYRNGPTGTKSLLAEVSFDFRGALDPQSDNRFVVTAGGTNVKLRWNDEGGGEASYHFDIHPGQAGHPMMHIQFAGAVKDIPRLHSVLAHPLDVLEFTLMEVFQENWRKSRVTTTFRDRIRKYPANQRRRILRLLETYKSWVESPDPALMSLLRSPTTPIDMYPAG